MNPHEGGYFFPPYVSGKENTEELKAEICYNVTIKVSAEFFEKWKESRK